MNKIFDFLLDLIFPNKCAICGTLANDSICSKCKIEIKSYEKNVINKYSNKYFDSLIYIFEYEGIIKSKIHEFKFFDKSYLGSFFAYFYQKNEKICRKIKSYDIITSVPINKERKKQRGYNQSGILASKIAKNSFVKYYDSILKKEKNNKQQKLLNKTDRINNVTNVYRINDKYKSLIFNKKVILVDDIYTTGSTVNECSKVLKQNGAKEVLVLVIAKD